MKPRVDETSAITSSGEASVLMRLGPPSEPIVLDAMEPEFLTACDTLRASSIRTLENASVSVGLLTFANLGRASAPGVYETFQIRFWYKPVGAGRSLYSLSPRKFSLACP